MQSEERRMQRLGQGGESPSSLEARAGAFLDEARPLRGLRDIEIGAIERRLLRRGRAGRGLWLWPALAAIAVLLVAGSVMALVGSWRPRWPFVGAASESDTPSMRRPSKSHATGGVAQQPGIVSAQPNSTTEPSNTPTESPVAPATGSAVKAPPIVVARRAPHQESPSPLSLSADSTLREGALSSEARSLSAALVRWRRDGNAPAALALLVAHEKRFAHGALAVESKVARAEILLALAQRDQALVVLDALGLASLPRARELETIRGELRAQRGRCQEARADLARVVAGADDDLSKRATRAMATCP